MVESPLNPYVSWERPEGPSRLVGRSTLVEALAASLRAPPFQEVVLLGRPGMGKTALIVELPRRLPKPGKYLAVWLRGRDPLPHDIHGFLRAVAGDIAREAGRSPPAPEGDFSSAFTRTWLPALLNGLSRKTLLLLVDDLDRLVRRYGEPLVEALQGLRAPALRGQVAIVYALEGREEALNPATVALLEGIPRLKVSTWSHADLETFARYGEADGTLTWPPHAVEATWRWTGGHPMLTRRLCCEVWALLHLERLEVQPEVTLGALKEAAAVTLIGARDTLRAGWAQLPPVTQLVAAVAAAAGEAPIPTERLDRDLQVIGAPPGTAALVLTRTALDRDDLLLFEPADATEERGRQGRGEPPGAERPPPGSVRFRSELIRRWVHTHRPIPVVIADIERQLARRLPQALLLTERAIPSDPAQLALTELAALDAAPAPEDTPAAAQGDDALQRAVDKLRTVAAAFPAVGRPCLLAALHAAAHHGSDEDRRLGWAAEALELDQTSPNALAERAAVWQARAARARLAGEAHAQADLEALRASAGVRNARARRETEAAEELQDIEDLLVAWRFADAAERMAPHRELLEEFYPERATALTARIEDGGFRAGDLARARDAIRVGQVQRALVLAQRALAFDERWPEARELMVTAQRALDTLSPTERTQPPPRTLLAARVPTGPAKGGPRLSGRVLTPRGNTTRPTRPPAIAPRPPPLPLPVVAAAGSRIQAAPATVPLANPSVAPPSGPRSGEEHPIRVSAVTSPEAAEPSRAPARSSVPSNERGWQLVAATLGVLVIILVLAHWYQRPREVDVAAAFMVTTSTPTSVPPALQVDGQTIALTGGGTSFTARLPVTAGSHLWVVTPSGMCADHCPGDACPACCPLCSGRFDAGVTTPTPTLTCTLALPTAPEVCDPSGVDEDCNGTANEADPGLTDATDWYPDADGDGYGDPTFPPLRGCLSTAQAHLGDGPVARRDDCDDRAADVHPGAPDTTADGIDQDCSGAEPVKPEARVTPAVPVDRSRPPQRTTLIDAAQAASVFTVATPEVVACGQRASMGVRLTPDTITVTARVYEDRGVGAVRVVKSTLDNRVVVKCITDVVWGLKFPAPGAHDGTPLTHTFLIP